LKILKNQDKKKTIENIEGQSNMDNPEKLATRRRKTKQKTQHNMC